MDNWTLVGLALSVFGIMFAIISLPAGLNVIFGWPKPGFFSDWLARRNRNATVQQAAYIRDEYNSAFSASRNIPMLIASVGGDIIHILFSIFTPLIIFILAMEVADLFSRSLSGFSCTALSPISVLGFLLATSLPLFGYAFLYLTFFFECGPRNTTQFYIREYTFEI